MPDFSNKQIQQLQVNRIQPLHSTHTPLNKKQCLASVSSQPSVSSTTPINLSPLFGHTLRASWRNIAIRMAWTHKVPKQLKYRKFRSIFTFDEPLLRSNTVEVRRRVDTTRVNHSILHSELRNQTEPWSPQWTHTRTSKQPVTTSTLRMICLICKQRLLLGMLLARLLRLRNKDSVVIFRANFFL